jgi:hypothetical protein
MFDTSYRTTEKLNLNSWVGIYRRTLKEGEPYQQLSYSFLYPIRDLHDDFPVSRFSLFLYVIDVVLLFKHKYQELVSTTHRGWRSRIPIVLGAWALGAFTVVLFLASFSAWVVVFGWIGIIFLVPVSFAVLYLTQLAMERGMIGDYSEAPVLLPWLTLVWAKRVIAWRVRAPELLIEQLPTAMLASPKPPAKTPTQGPHARGSTLQRDLREDRLRLPSRPQVAIPRNPKFTARSRLMSWPAAIVSCVVVLLLLSPLVLRASQLSVFAVRVFDLTRQTSNCERQVPAFKAEISMMTTREAERPELERLHDRLSGEREQIDSLVATADTLNGDSPTTLGDGYLRRAVIRLTSAKEQIRTLDSRVSEWIAQDDNTKEWDALGSSLTDLRNTIASFREPALAASVAEVEPILQGDEHLRSQLENLRTTATSFHDRLLRGGKQPNVGPILEAIESLNKTLDERRPRLLAYLSSAQLRQAASKFLNEVPALLADIRVAGHVEPETASLEALRKELQATNAQEDRLEDLRRNGQWIRDQSISVPTRSEIERATGKLEDASNSLSERGALLERKVRSAEFRAALPKFVATTDKLTSDLRHMKSTTFQSPDQALTAIDELRNRVDEVLRQGSSLKSQVEDTTQSETLDTQVLKLNEDLKDLDAETANWSAQLDAEQKHQAITAIRGRIQEVLANAAESPAEANSVIKEIDSIQEEWERLGRPAELSAEMQRARLRRQEVERKLYKWQRESGPPQRARTGVQFGKDSLLEARCATLVQDYKLDGGQMKDVDTFLSEDAPALRTAMTRVASGPRVLDLLVTYGRAAQRLSHLRQIESSMPSLKETVSSFLTQSHDIIGNSQLSEKCRDTLAPLVVSAASIDERLTAIEQLSQQLETTNFEQRLLKDESEAKQMAWSWAILVFATSVLAAAAFGFFILFSRHCDKKGLAELKTRQTFDELLRFVVSNGFSRTVNVKAIAHLQAKMKSSPEALRMLSDAAQAREKRGPGVLNGDVATQLRELARGMDNILNR